MLDTEKGSLSVKIGKRQEEESETERDEARDGEKKAHAPLYVRRKWLVGELGIIRIGCV